MGNRAWTWSLLSGCHRDQTFALVRDKRRERWKVCAWLSRSRCYPKHSNRAHLVDLSTCWTICNCQQIKGIANEYLTLIDRIFQSSSTPVPDIGSIRMRCWSLDSSIVCLDEDAAQFWEQTQDNPYFCDIPVQVSYSMVSNESFWCGSDLCKLQTSLCTVSVVHWRHLPR